MIYYSLARHIYAASLGQIVILLDSKHDDYISLIDDSGNYLKIILDNGFVLNQDNQIVPVNNVQGIDMVDLNDWIIYFLENNFIIQCSADSKKKLAPDPLKQGGLIEYAWDYKTSWRPFAKAKKACILQSFLELARVHRLLKRRGIQGVLDRIQNVHSKKKNSEEPTQQNIDALSSSIDAASIIYPKQTFCLSWAATFVIRALKKNWPVQLVIGVQVDPFYAHAWAEIGGNVIHDDPVIAQVLSIIFKEPL